MCYNILKLLKLLLKKGSYLKCSTANVLENLVAISQVLSHTLNTIQLISKMARVTMHTTQISFLKEGKIFIICSTGARTELVIHKAKITPFYV